MTAFHHYEVQEDGLRTIHNVQKSLEPCSPAEFLESFRNDFQMNILDQPDKDTLVFEMINVDVSFANAVRRILLANIPTVAIEKIFLFNNTSIIHDEVLSHRIGLIPLDIDARLFDNLETGDDETDRNTVVFNLNVECEPRGGNKNKNDRSSKSRKGKNAVAVVDAEDAGETSKAGLLVNKGEPYTMNVYSRHLQWVPQGDQERFLADRPPRPLHDDILIAQLRPGQAIELQAHAIRGTDHAKYSPVATASYRLLPRIELLEDIPAGPDADELMNLYEPGVFAINDRGVVVVKNVYACTMSRNFMRNPTLKRAIRMTRVPNHFIFSVESVGAYPPGVLVSQALGILQQKCHRLLDLVDGTDHVGQDE